MNDYENEYEEVESVEEEEKDDLDESMEVIEEEKAFEDTQYDEDDQYIGDDPEVTDPNDWATPEFTPEGSDIPVTVDLEMMGENMIEEGNAILEALGPSGNPEFDALVLDKDKTTVSYVDPDDPSVIKQVDSEQDDFEGLGFDSDYLEERTYEGDGSSEGDFDDDDDDFEGDDEEVTLDEDDKEF